MEHQKVTENPSDFDSTNLIAFLYKYRKPLIILSFSAAIISAIASFFIREKYLSTVVLFPASTSSISKSVMTEDAAGKNDIVAFGEEEQAEQMLQILNSDMIRSTIRDKYDLMKHYRIKSDEKYPITKFNKMWESNVTYKRTEFLSIRIDVLAFNPDTAALIANDIAQLLDDAKNKMQQDRAKEALQVIEAEFNKFQAHLELVDDSITKIRERGLQDFETQIEMLSEQYYRALAEGNSSGAKKLEEKLGVFSKYGSAYMALFTNAEYERERLIMLRSKYEETKVDATQNIPHKFVVNQAYRAEKKEYPIRWLIVVISTISTFLFTAIAIIAVENYKRITEKAV
jgi:uncharacterized protein involved in exopolysaccharide biosynthesis